MQYIPPPNGDTGNPNRSYIDGNPGTGTEGSIIPAAAIEHTQREILAVIAAAGIVPAAGDLTQLLAAINVIISGTALPDASTTTKGRVELTTGPEALGGTDTTRAVTSAALASGQSLTSNGHKTLPGGLIFQWGTTPSVAITASYTVLLPVTYPNAHLYADASKSGSNATQRSDTVGAYSLSGITINNGSPDTASSFRWFSIGY